MDIEIPRDVRATAVRLGGGVPYALRAVAGQLADDPDMGRPSGPPGVLTVTVDGDMFEDCPELAIGYIREPDRIEIRFLTATPYGASTDDHGPDLEPGRQLDERADGWGCLPGNCALMNLDAVAATYRLKMSSQAEHDRLDIDHPIDERITVWRSSWIPVVGFGPTDSTSGLYLDSTTGYLGRWSRYNEEVDDELDTLVTYLEETADMLDTPALATRDRPGLIGGTLVWLSSIDPAREGRWQPLTG